MVRLRSPLRRRRGGGSVPLVAAAGIGFGIMALIGGGGGTSHIAEPARLAAPASGECNIKGNVSMDDGDRIYHVPGQRYYAETVINARHGERWFCSEAEARAAGWRKSRR